MRSSGLSLAAGVVPLLSGALAGWDPNAKNNVAVYWGQDLSLQLPGVAAADPKNAPYNQTLDGYCKTQDDVDIYALAFLTNLSVPILNFGFSGGSLCQKDPADPTGAAFTCPALGTAIQACQQDSNKTILLTIGGDTFSEPGWTKPEDAVKAAQTLWSQFGPKDFKPPATALRPFRDATINGFHLDFPKTLPGLPDFAKELRRIIDQANSAQGDDAPDQPFLLTATPQCPRDFKYTDAKSDGAKLANADTIDSVFFDALWVQYYNNPECDLRTFNPNKKWSQQPGFNLEKWGTWAGKRAPKPSDSKKPDTKILMAIAGSKAAAPAGGFTPAKTVNQAIKKANGLVHFAGIAVWELGEALKNGNYLGRLDQSLNKTGSTDDE